MKKPKELIILSIPATKGKWQIYKSGKEYGNRLVSRNGRIITGNKGFNSLKIALNNIKTVKESA